jgi:lysophospholipase L1-like esterase
MGRVRIVFAVVAAAAITACSGCAAHIFPATYYLALGDSLSQGVQPDAAGASVETGQGYTDQLYAALLPAHPGLRLVKLGCPGETTRTMIYGGICRYPGGSQLAATVAFLRAHRGHMFLITIDIGANDPEDCGSESSLSKLVSCFATGVPDALTNLATIMTRLQAAAPGVRVVGMTYYLPALAEWRNGTAGQVIARLSEKLAAKYSELLGRVYTESGARVADVFSAFDTSNFGNQVTVPGIGTVPRNVALVCQWTWACAAPPRGPDQHANQAGYEIIAQTFQRAAGLGERDKVGEAAVGGTGAPPRLGSGVVSVSGWGVPQHDTPGRASPSHRRARAASPTFLVALRGEVEKLLPEVEIADLPLEVHGWTGFLDEYTHVSGAEIREDGLNETLSALLVSEACNIGLTPVVDETRPALTRGRLNWAAHNYLRSATHAAGNVRLAGYHTPLPLAKAWGGGEMASADGMRFVVPVATINAAYNPRYFGRQRGSTLYSWMADTYTVFAQTLIPGTQRDSLYVLGGLIANQTGIRPEMVSTAGASEIIFALAWALGYRWAPRLADLPNLWGSITGSGLDGLAGWDHP